MVKANSDNSAWVGVISTTVPPRVVAVQSPTPILMTIAFFALAQTITCLSVIYVWTPALLFIAGL